MNVSGYQAINMGDNLGVDANGLAIVGCVIERSGGAGAPMMVLAQGGNTEVIVENIVLQQITLVGARANVCYQDLITAETYKHVYLQHSVFYEMNHKCDTTGQNNFTGNWATRYKVGHKVNAYTQGDSRPAGGVGPDSWIGEILAVGSAFGQTYSPLNVDWTDDRSGSTDTGGGDYHPGDNTVIPAIPAGDAPYPIDMSGLAIANDGAAVVGALQKYSTTGNRTPVANAGADQTLTDADDNGAEDVTLDGSASTDADGTITGYVWTAGGAQIATGASATISMGVDTHVVTLTVTDDQGASDDDSVVVTITAFVNVVPSADAGDDQTVKDNDDTGDEDVTLDGSGSSDSDGAIDAYVWEDSAAELATGATPTVTLAVGVHTIDLTVTDNGGATDSDSVIVTVNPFGNLPPVAVAGDDQSVTDADSDGSEDITLDGSASTDADGVIVGYVWEDASAQIATGVSPIVTMDVGEHTIDLFVTDDAGATGSDRVIVTVKPAGAAPILIDFGDDPDATGGDQTDWIIITPDDVNGGGVVDLGNGVTLTKAGATDFTERDIPFGSSLPDNYTYNGVEIPDASVAKDFFKSSSDPVKISGLDAGDYDVTIFESYNAPLEMFIWVGEQTDKPGTSNTGNISQTFVTISVTITDPATEDLWVQISNSSFGANGLVIEPLTVAPPAKQGDANGDGDVDLDDFVILKTNFGTLSGATAAQGDFDGDGDVDLDDFVIMKVNFGT